MHDLGFDVLLVRGAAALAAVGVLWALAILLAAALEAATSGRVAFAHRLGCPAVVRVALVAAISVLLLGNQAATARGAVEPPPRSVDGLALPTRTVDPAQRQEAAARSVTVRPGDSLWRIARRTLPTADARPGDTDLADAVRSLYAANRATIGADPGLLRPGQVLRLPHDFPTPITYSEER